MAIERSAIAVVVLAAVVQFGLATQLDLLADEAYYWVWSQTPAMGYYDQPPLIAWAIALSTTVLGQQEWAVRAPGILVQLAGYLALLHAARDRQLELAVALVGLPVLFWLGAFATPDALLIGLWAGGLAAWLLRRWVWFGALCGAAALTKYTGVALLVLGLAALARHRPAPKVPAQILAVFGLLVAPHLVWLARNDAVSVRFQLHEGWLHPHAPGVWGPLLVVGQQLAVATPAAAVMLVQAWSQRHDRRVGLGLFTSIPLFAFFAGSAVGGPPEPHWLAIAWVGGALAASQAPRAGRSLQVAAGMGLTLSLLGAAHLLHPLGHWSGDPTLQFHQGRPLAEWVGTWALPLGASPRGADAESVAGVATERYQEAAWIHYYAGIPATVSPDCGRATQYSLAAVPEPRFYVRPTRSGPLACDSRVTWREWPEREEVIDRFGRNTGSWDLFVVEP